MRTARSSAALLLLSAVPAWGQAATGCEADALYPEALCPQGPLFLPEGFVQTRTFARRAGETARAWPDATAFDRPGDVPGKLAACWTPPPGAGQVTVRVSFNANGRVIGTPAIPFADARTGDGRRALRESLLAAVRLCTPLRFTPSLGRAIAGRIFAIRFILRDR